MFVSLYLLHVSATLVAILREVYSKGWILQGIKKVCELVHSRKILSGLKYTLKHKIKIQILVL